MEQLTYKDIALRAEVADIHSALHAVYDASCSAGQVMEGAQMAALRGGEAAHVTHVVLAPLQHVSSVHD